MRKIIMSEEANTPPPPADRLVKAIKSGVSSGKPTPPAATVTPPPIVVPPVGGAEMIDAAATTNETPTAVATPDAPEVKSQAEIAQETRNKVLEKARKAYEEDHKEEGASAAFDAGIVILGDPAKNAEELFAKAQELGMSAHDLVAVLPERPDKRSMSAEVQTLAVNKLLAELPEFFKLQLNEFSADQKFAVEDNLKTVLHFNMDSQDPVARPRAVEAASRLPFDNIILKSLLANQGYSEAQLNNFFKDVDAAKRNLIREELDQSPTPAPVAEGDTDASSDAELSPAPLVKDLQTIAKGASDLAERVANGEPVSAEQVDDLRKSFVEKYESIMVGEGGVYDVGKIMGTYIVLPMVVITFVGTMLFLAMHAGGGRR